MLHDLLHSAIEDALASNQTLCSSKSILRNASRLLVLGQIKPLSFGELGESTQGSLESWTTSTSKKPVGWSGKGPLLTLSALPRGSSRDAPPYPFCWPESWPFGESMLPLCTLRLTLVLSSTTARFGPRDQKRRLLPLKPWPLANRSPTPSSWTKTWGSEKSLAIPLLLSNPSGHPSTTT